MSAKESLSKLSKMLFWDMDMEQVDMDTCPSQIIQRVLEYGTLSDWRIIRSYYGLEKIVDVCRKLRTLDPVALSFISSISNTDKKEYRCYRTKQSNPTLWNS
jgi:hypothetical protein